MPGTGETVNRQISGFFDSAPYKSFTTGDVVLEPAATECRPDHVDLTTRLTDQINLRAPFMSAAMDTVTTAEMAIAQAKEGGIGIIHGLLSPDQKRKETRRVKLHLNGVVEDPICAKEDQTVASLLDMCHDRGFEFRTFPVIDSDGKLRGMLTNHNLRFWTKGEDQKVTEIMTAVDEVISAPMSTTIPEAYQKMRREQLNTLPLIGTDGSVRGLYIWSDVERLHTGNPERYALDNDGHLLVGVAIGSRPEEAEEDVYETRPYTDVYVIDSSHGNALEVRETVEHLRQSFGPDLQIIAGNIVDQESAILLGDAGASAIKVGIGGGSICTTRIQTGVGMGQLTATYRVAAAINENRFNIPVISDGGIIYPGDAAKLIAVGAESVMMGSVFAGTDEAPGEITTTKDGRTVKEYRGMGSAAAQLTGRQVRGYTSGAESNEVFPEGVEAQVDYKGPVKRIIFDFKSGLRNAMANFNARTIKDFQRNARLGEVTTAGAVEGTPHIGRVGQIIRH
jgi:IMP dehydrogenase